MIPGTSRTLLDGTVIIDHEAQVPLDHSRPGGERIRIYAREFISAEAAARGPETLAAMPWLLYFQGGPGGRGARPARLNGWMEEASARFRILMLDQRGTGLSTPLTQQTLTRRGDAADQARYMRHFRADSIVRDAEMLRIQLGLESWSVLGQSFGGFCTLTYLSFFPESLDRAMITGGLGPLDGHPDQVYQATYQKMRRRNDEFFARFPADHQRWAQVVEHVRSHAVRLPDGSALTVPRLQMLGMLLGGNTRIDTLHYLLEDAFAEGSEHLSEAFLHALAHTISFAGHPLYAVLHESIYGQPAERMGGNGATAWAAYRMLEEHPDFSSDAPVPHLLGEMIFPEHIAVDPVLAPLTDASEVLARTDDWPPLYDLDRLARNTVPAAAAVYTDDVYVAREISLRTADRVSGLTVWETSEFHHDGLSDDGARILRELLSRTDAVAA